MAAPLHAYRLLDARAYAPIRTAVARAALRTLRERTRDATLVTDLVDQAFESARRLTNRAMTAGDPGRRMLPVCDEGCAFCCYQQVVTSPIEALRIATHLGETLSPKALADVRAGLVETGARVAALTPDQRLAARLPCPLLDPSSQGCTVHEVRPLVCRGYNSCSVTACMAAIDNADSTTHIPANYIQQASMTAAATGLQAACQIEGLEWGAFELSAAVGLALEDSDGAPGALARWLEGERPFERLRSNLSAIATRALKEDVDAVVSALRAGDPDAPAAKLPDDARRERNKRKRALGKRR